MSAEPSNAGPSNASDAEASKTPKPAPVHPPALPVLPRPQHPTPDEAFELLVEGNLRFAGGAPARPNQDDERRNQVVSGQEPFAAILGCADSRVPAEIVFDQGLGDLFVCRTAGPVVDQAVMGSIEFAIANLHVPLVVVMGHESCGALKAAADTADGILEPTGAVRDLVERVLPMALQANREGGSKEHRLSRAIELNVERVQQILMERSRVITDAVANGSIKVVGAVYDLEGGKARFF